MRNEEGIDKDALSNLVLGPLSVVARDERHVQRDVLRDAIVDDDDRGGGGGEEEKTKMETMVLRSERAVEKLERSLFEIDREIEAVEAATKDLGVEEAKKKEEKTPLRDVKLRKQVAAKRVAGLREKRSKVEKELDAALEVSEVERRAFEREKKKKKDASDADAKKTGGVPPEEQRRRPKVVVQDDFDFDAELDAVQKKTTTNNLLGGGSNGETERERLIRIGAMTPFDRLDGFDKARTDEAGKKLKEKAALLQSAKSKLKTIDLKDAPKQMEKMHSRAIGEAISRRVKPTKNGDSAAKKKLALKRKQWKEQSEQQQNKKKNGASARKKRRSSFQAYSSDEEELDEIDIN